jgi:LacI family transcriptional regulator
MSGGINMRSVAEQVGVSVATVSRVLNDKPAVSAATQARVLAAVQKMGYRIDPVLSQASRHQRSGRSGNQPVRTRTIGLLMRQHEQNALQQQNPYYGALMAGIDEVLHRNDYHAMWTSYDGETDELPRMVKEGRVDGLLVACEMEEAATRRLAQYCPLVFVDHDPRGVPADTVTPDWEQATRVQLESLWALGHRHIVTFQHVWLSSERIVYTATFEAFFRGKGLPIPSPTLCVPREITPATHEQVMRAYAEELAAARPRPTALVATNGYAIGIMKNLEDLGLRVPGDISVIGLNDNVRADLTRPPLTSYRMPREHLGRAAADLLMQRIEDPSLPPRRLTLQGERIERESCGPPPAEASRGGTGDAMKGTGARSVGRGVDDEA